MKVTLLLSASVLAAGLAVGCAPRDNHHDMCGGRGMSGMSMRGMNGMNGMNNAQAQPAAASDVQGDQRVLPAQSTAAQPVADNRTFARPVAGRSCDGR